MADAGFNGSTISIDGSGATPLRSIDYDDGDNAVDLSGCADSTHEYVNGLSDPVITCEVVGRTTVSKGDTGSVSVSWNDGQTDSITSAVVTGISASGSLDGEILSTITLRPYGGS